MSDVCENILPKLFLSHFVLFTCICTHDLLVNFILCLKVKEFYVVGFYSVANFRISHFNALGFYCFHFQEEEEQVTKEVYLGTDH